MRFIGKRTIKLDKIPTLLDKFVIKICRIIEKHTKYVVVSGYVAILFGRSRATEDIDLIIRRLPKEKFHQLYADLTKKGYWCINSKTRKNAFQMIRDGIGLRFAKRKSIIPNVEMKFAKNEINEEALDDNLTVKLPTGKIIISRIEQQIAFKEIILASQKDLEDAKHLEIVFKDEIDKRLLEKYRARLKK